VTEEKIIKGKLKVRNKKINIQTERKRCGGYYWEIN
jgi:hypothetical protein